MPAAAIPLVTAGVGAYSAWRSSKDAKNASTPTAAEQSATQAQTGAANAQTGLAGQLAGQSGTLFRQGLPQLQQAGRYFSTLAAGNRGAMTQALSPEISSVNDVYGGTAKTLSRFLRGPEKSVQMGEAERERAGVIGRLFSGGRSGAATALGGLGGGAIGASDSAAGGASSALGSAGSLFGNISSAGAANRLSGAAIQRQAGQDTGSFLFNLLKLYSTQGKGGGSSLSPYGGGGAGDQGPGQWSAGG